MNENRGNHDFKNISLEDFLDLPDDIALISKAKVNISKIIAEQCKVQNISIRKLAKNVGLKHPQIIRITSGDANYNIDTLLKVLIGLNLEVEIKPKTNVLEEGTGNG